MQHGNDVDVAIIGFGPTGVIGANLVGAAGIRTVVVERERDVYHRARAVTVDGSTMRLFQSLGLDEAAKADMDVTTALRFKTYAGLEFFRVAPSGAEEGHANAYMIFQPALERTLRAGVDRYDCVDVRFGSEFTGLVQRDDGVDVTVRDVASGAESNVSAAYVIAADGGTSAVRRDLGIRMDGETRARTWIVIDAKIKRWWPERDLLTFWSDPVRPVVDIPLSLDYHRWEIPLNDDERKEDFDSDEAVWRLLGLMGIDASMVTIHSHAFYNHHVRQAQTWRSGRVLLAGDAAHLMPPWAGQGMQSGMRDALNLSWKLRSILTQGQPGTLLDTYQTERQPSVAAATRSSVGMGKLIESEPGPQVVLRNRVLPVISKLPVLGARFRKGMQINHDLHAGFLARDPAKDSPIGRRLPQPGVADQTGHRALLDDSLGRDFAIIGLDVDPATVLSAAQRAGWAPFEPRYLTVRSAKARPESDADLVDYQNVLAPWFTKYGTRVLVLRPDRFVGASDGTSLDVPAPRGVPLPAALRDSAPSLELGAGTTA